MPRSMPVLLAFVLAACASHGGTTSSPPAFAAPTAATLPPLGPVPSGVRVSTHLLEYPVTAATVTDLRREMLRAGPTAEGSRYPGATHWNVRWTYQYDRQGIRCALRDIRAIVDARVEVPRWEPAGVPDSAVVRWWDGFQSRLIAHEHGHVRLAVDAGAAIVDALRPLSGGACDALGMQANGVAQNLLVKARERQAAYDRDTRHGAIPAAGPARPPGT